MNKSFHSFSLIVALAACGGAPSTGSPDDTNPDDSDSDAHPDEGSEDGSDSDGNPDDETDPSKCESLNPEISSQEWDIQSQTCNGKAVQSAAETYYFAGPAGGNASRVARIDKTSEDASSVCRTTYIYNRTVGSKNASCTEYEETATLESLTSTTSCWEKENGQPVEPAIPAAAGAFGPERLDMKLLATATGVSLDVAGSPDCETGTLHIELTKRTAE